MSLVSIIIPIYNREKYIEKTLLSVLKQPTFDYEIIIINDGSTDKSLQICEMYSKQYDCIKIYSQENKGVSVARNLGIKKSSGKYIMFLDSDDYYVDNFFDNQLESELNNDYDLLAYSSYASNIKRNRYAVEQRFKDMVISCCQWTPTGHFGSCIYLKEMLIKNDIWFDEGIRINEDLAFKFKAFHCANKIRFLSEFCHIYNSTAKSTSKHLGCQYDYVDVWYRTYDWLKNRPYQQNTQASVHYVRLKITSRMLLYAKTYIQVGHNQEELIKDLKLKNGYDMLMSINDQQVLPYLKKDLYLFQNDMKAFIAKARKEGNVIKIGRVLLHIPLVRYLKDKKQYNLNQIY